MEAIVRCFPKRWADSFQTLDAGMVMSLEEIRVRQDRKLCWSSSDRTMYSDWSVTADECQQFFRQITDHSLFAYEEQLKRGYITLQGGHRVGFCGRTVVENGVVKMIRDVASFNIRIARARVNV
ncbi:MAG: stage III sporulation protein AA, partial [Bacilli bacterium]